MRAPRGAVAIATVALVGIAASASGRRVGVPPSIELDGCVRPAEACSLARDVVELDDGTRKLSFAVEALRLRTNPRASTGKLLTELKLRPLRVHAPDEILQKLQPGAHVRVRGALHLGPRQLLVQGVEPLPEHGGPSR